jgi:hypothetical protein
MKLIPQPIARRRGMKEVRLRSKSARVRKAILVEPLEARLVLSVFLGDLTPLVASNGYGPWEQNLSNGANVPNDGEQIRLNGQGYARGLGVHAPSSLKYDLGGRYSAFEAVVGVDDETNGAGSVEFQVYADGALRFDSGTMTASSTPRTAFADVRGAQVLELKVTTAGDNANSDHADWANAVLTEPGPVTYLSDLPWDSATNGWGPVERDMEVGEVAAGDGAQLQIDGYTYAKGLGVNAPSTITYTLGGAYSRFQATVGIDDGQGYTGSSAFEVYGDSVLLYASPIYWGHLGGGTIDVDVSGVNQLQLITTDGGNGAGNDHADWANARLTAAQSAAPNNDPGSVNISRRAEPDFDWYANATDPTMKAWMRTNYDMVMNYAGTWDSKLGYFPRAMLYKDGMGIHFNATDINGNSIATTHPDWILHDANGNFVYVDYGNHDQYAVDVSNPDFQRDWIAQALRDMGDGTAKGIDWLGLWIDDVNMAWDFSNSTGGPTSVNDPNTGSGLSTDHWRAYYADFLEHVRAALPPTAPIIHNARYFDGDASNPDIARQIAAADLINLERGVNDSGIVPGDGQYGYLNVLNYVDAAHGLGKGVIYNGWSGTVDDTIGAEYALATYFLTSNGLDYVDNPSLMNPPLMNSTRGGAWWSGYNTHLVSPLGARYFVGGTSDDILRRDFERGIVLTAQPGTSRTHTVTLSGQYLAPGGTNPSNVVYNAGANTTTVTLAPGTGYVLSRALDAVVTAPSTDMTTQGNWKAAYGSEGFGLLTEPVSDAMSPNISYPRYANVTLDGSSTVWTWSTSDPRATPIPWGDPGDRHAEALSGGTSVSIDVDLADHRLHSISLYFLDWDNQGRSERVDVVDVNSGQVLDSQSLSNFSGGTYLSWDVFGHVKFVITKLSGPDAVVSGIFFDPAASASQLNLAGTFNQAGIVNDGDSFAYNGGIDGYGYAYSASELGGAIAANGTTFLVGAPGTNDVVSAAGQTICLPQGNYATLNLLAAAVNGNQPNQSFVVTYLDGTTQTFVQSVSDWCNNQNYSGETVALATGYRDHFDGTQDTGSHPNVYAYAFDLDPRTIQSITLPNNGNIKILALTLSSGGTAGMQAITPPLAPQQVSMIVNDGSAQRSMVRSATITFARSVSLDAGAIQVLNRATGAAPALTISPESGWSTSYTLTFGGAGGAPADGWYDITLLADKVHDMYGQTLPGNLSFSFFRLFGDIDGNGKVDMADNRPFTAALAGGASAYAWYFDFNGDGKIDMADNRNLVARLGTSI